MRVCRSRPRSIGLRTAGNSQTTKRPWMLNYDKIVLFGDSITEFSFNSSKGFGFGLQLANGKYYVHFKIDIF